MKKFRTNIVLWVGIIVSSALKWLGGLMDLLDLPNLGQKVNDFSEKIGPTYYPYIYIGFFLVLILIVNWSDASSFFNRQPAKIKKEAPKQPIQASKPATQESPAIPLKVERDILLVKAVRYIAYGSWGPVEINYADEKQLNDGHDALMEIKQKAFDGSLPIWGVEIGGGPLLKPIPKEYWEHHGFKSLSFGINDPKEFCTKEDVYESDITIYNSLMTSKAKVEELWPSELPEIKPSVAKDFGRNYSLLDAIYYIATGKEDYKFPDREVVDRETADQETIKTMGTIDKAIESIRQLAYEGVIPIWGKSALLPSVFLEIKPEFWFQNAIDSESIYGSDNDPGKLKTCIDGIGVHFGYVHLMTNKEKVRELWPVENSQDLMGSVLRG